ncbi:MAG TPA: DUF4328 domain-containing protein [Chitinophagaceae bacterium]|nr:DUF4328 domain-containing protein [Chitinophagaceae bacterium]
MITLKPNEERAKNAVMLIWIVMILDIAGALSGYFQYRLLSDAARGVEISPQAVEANDYREQMIGIVQLAFVAVAGIVFIKWFRRAYDNMHRLTSYLSFEEKWAALSWFVPIIGWFRPYQIMKEMYQEIFDILEKKGLGSGKQYIGLLGTWWGLWLFSNFLGQILFRYSMKADTIEELTYSTIGNIIHCLSGIPLAIVAVKVVKTYSAAETALAASFETVHVMSNDGEDNPAPLI